MSGRVATTTVAILIASLVFSGCKTTPVAVTSSTTPLHDKKIVENFGAVKGSHRAWSVFGLWMIGRPDTDRAIRKALDVHGGDALINVTCYEKMTWYFFVSSHEVVVEGEAVAFQKEAPVDIEPVPREDAKRGGREGKNGQKPQKKR